MNISAVILFLLLSCAGSLFLTKLLGMEEGWLFGIGTKFPLNINFGFTNFAISYEIFWFVFFLITIALAFYLSDFSEKRRKKEEKEEMENLASNFSKAQSFYQKSFSLGLNKEDINLKQKEIEHIAWGNEIER